MHLTLRRWLLAPALLLVPVAIALAGIAVAEDKPAAPAVPPGIEGGDAIPAGLGNTITFPWIGKQSITATSDAFERMVAQVDFSDDKHAELGRVTLDGKGGGTGAFTVQVKDLHTGSTARDGHLASGGWLDADSNPALVLKITKLTQVKPTAWWMEGTWTMHGVTKPISAWANVRYLPELPYLAKQIVRVKTTFDVALKAHGLMDDAIGSPVVADAWKVDVVALGVLTK